MGHYELSQLAVQDLARIYEYGILNFGIIQAQDYLIGLQDSFQILADNKLFGRSAERIAPNLRKLEYETDVIYYVPNQNGILIVRVLHQSMDHPSHF